jgi:hypothetical protein
MIILQPTEAMLELSGYTRLSIGYSDARIASPKEPNLPSAPRGWRHFMGTFAAVTRF